MRTAKMHRSTLLWPLATLLLSALGSADYISVQQDSKNVPKTIITVTKKTVKYSGLDLEKRQATIQTSCQTSLGKCSLKTTISGTPTTFTGELFAFLSIQYL